MRCSDDAEPNQSQDDARAVEACRAAEEFRGRRQPGALLRRLCLEPTSAISANLLTFVRTGRRPNLEGLR